MGSYGVRGRLAKDLSSSIVLSYSLHLNQVLQEVGVLTSLELAANGLSLILVNTDLKILQMTLRNALCVIT